MKKGFLLQVSFASAADQWLDSLAKSSGSCLQDIGRECGDEKGGSLKTLFPQYFGSKECSDKTNCTKDEDCSDGKGCCKQEKRQEGKDGEISAGYCEGLSPRRKGAPKKGEKPENEFADDIMRFLTEGK